MNIVIKWCNASGRGNWFCPLPYSKTSSIASEKQATRAYLNGTNLLLSKNFTPFREPSICKEGKNNYSHKQHERTQKGETTNRCALR